MTETTYELALRILEFRARSVDELRRKLRQKGQDPAEIELVLARLVDQKLLDDAAYARTFARSKLTSAGKSRRRVSQELGRKGITREVADRAIDELAEDEGIDPSASIHRIAEKKWKTLATLDDFTRRRRLYAFLARRGFDPDEIKSVMNAIGEEIET